MISKVGFCYQNHTLQCREAWSKEDIIITIAKDSSIDIFDEASIAADFKDLKELEAVETINKPSQNLALTDSISYVEA